VKSVGNVLFMLLFACLLKFCFPSVYRAGTGTGFFATGKPSLRLLRYLIQFLNSFRFAALLIMGLWLGWVCLNTAAARVIPIPTPVSGCH